MQIAKDKKVRVLIADDSFFMRNLVRGILNSDKSIEVVGEAKDGFEVIELSRSLHPDVITMDYNMPNLNGYRAIQKIVDTIRPIPSIVVLSAHTKSGSDLAIQCLEAGAIDVVFKPSGELSIDLSKQQEEIIKKVHVASMAHISIHHREVNEAIVKDSILTLEDGEVRKLKEIQFKPKIIIIGASTGGPPIVEYILRQIPADYPIPIIVAQHMPKLFTSTFSKRLNKMGKIEIREAESGMSVMPGIFFNPGDRYLNIVNSDNVRIFKFKKIPENTKEESVIDHAMFSVSKSFHSNVAGIILTGMGRDGQGGMRSIKDAGGYTIVQSPSTAVIASMPEAIIKSIEIDEILTPAEILGRILSWGKIK